MLWLKAFHVVFMVTWFAGLFYLPRLFVYHADTRDDLSHQRFVVMERRLFVLMTIGASLTALFGVTLIARAPALLQGGWLQLKLALVAGLLLYHVICYKLMMTFRQGVNQRSGRWYRSFNEVPSVLLIAIVLLAVARPF